jgi:hypothetical protein
MMDTARKTYRDHLRERTDPLTGRPVFPLSFRLDPVRTLAPVRRERA